MPTFGGLLLLFLIFFIVQLWSVSLQDTDSSIPPSCLYVPVLRSAEMLRKVQKAARLKQTGFLEAPGVNFQKA